MMLLTASCRLVKESSKHNFNDGIYHTGLLSKNEVYVYNIDDDTISVSPVLEFPDSTAVLTKQRTLYTSTQKKFKDNKADHTFYKPSLDIDLMTLPLIYRPTIYGFPNQLTYNFNGAAFVGYRVDAYHLDYKRTPFNVYKQTIKHFGYSAGGFAGFGSTLINGWVSKNNAIDVEYEGVTFNTGIAFNAATENFTFGIAVGTGFLLDKYHQYWIYQGEPFVGFTVGFNIN